MEKTKYRYLSWEEFDQDCAILAKELQHCTPSFKRIVAITRGGLIPAAVISKILGIRLIDTVCIASYSKKEKTFARILKGEKCADQDVLILDDMVDTGETVKIVRDLFPFAHIATVYVKPHGKELVNTFAKIIEPDVWIVFPWEKK